MVLGIPITWPRQSSRGSINNMNLDGVYSEFAALAEALLSVPPREAFQKLVSCTHPIYSSEPISNVHAGSWCADSPWEWFGSLIK